MLLKSFLFVILFTSFNQQFIYALKDGDKLSKTKDNKDNLNLIFLNYSQKGTFIYKNSFGEPVSVEIFGDVHVEYYDNKQYKIVSSIEWLNKKEFQLTVIENTLLDSDIKLGETMKIQIKKLKRNKTRFKAFYNKKVWINTLWFVPTK